MSYEPGVVEQRVAKRLRVSVSEVMAFLDVYAEEFIRFTKEPQDGPPADAVSSGAAEVTVTEHPQEPAEPMADEAEASVAVDTESPAQTAKAPRKRASRSSKVTLDDVREVVEADKA